ncbi:Germinal-center associated nuclear protein, partial [Dictyocoela roeselum]
MKLENQYEKLKRERSTRPQPIGSLKGECRDFCPEFEKIERQLRNDISPFESKILVKKYHRSSAGKQRSLPEDVRPLDILEATFDYLVRLLATNIKSKPFEIYRFVEDRCRAIRQDISVQALECDRTILLLLRICRFHVFFNHYLYDDSNFDIHLNKDQIRRILVSIMDIHEKKNVVDKKLFDPDIILAETGKRVLSGIEEEYISYFIISNLPDNDVYYKMAAYTSRSYPHTFTSSSLVELALKMMVAYQRNDWVSFFGILKKAPFMFSAACLSFIDMQKRSLAYMKQCFYEKISLEWVSIRISCDLNYTKAMAQREGIAIDGDKINFRDKNVPPKEIVVRPQKIREIENKRAGEVDSYINHGHFIFEFCKDITSCYVKQFLKDKLSGTIIRDNDVLNKKRKRPSEALVKRPNEREKFGNKELEPTAKEMISFKTKERLSPILKERIYSISKE